MRIVCSQFWPSFKDCNVQKCDGCTCDGDDYDRVKKIFWCLIACQSNITIEFLACKLEKNTGQGTIHACSQRERGSDDHKSNKRIRFLACKLEENTKTKGCVCVNDSGHIV